MQYTIEVHFPLTQDGKPFEGKIKVEVEVSASTSSEATWKVHSAFREVTGQDSPSFEWGLELGKDVLSTIRAVRSLLD